MKYDTAQLVERMKQGDPASFRDILDWYAQDVLRLCYLMLMDADEAKDMLQETMMRFIKRIQSKPFYAHNGSVKAYLLTCARNLCIDRLRRRKHFVYSLQDIPDVEWQPTHDANPAQAMEDRLFEDHFSAALQQLTNAERAVLVLFDVEGYTHPEVSEQLGIEVNNSKTLLHRARRKLRVMLKAYENRG